MSKDEEAAALAWAEYFKAMTDMSFTLTSESYDAFFAGFYRGRDYEKDKNPLDIYQPEGTIKAN